MKHIVSAIVDAKLKVVYIIQILKRLLSTPIITTAENGNNKTIRNISVAASTTLAAKKDFHQIAHTINEPRSKVKIITTAEREEKKKKNRPHNTIAVEKRDSTLNKCISQTYSNVRK